MYIYPCLTSVLSASSYLDYDNFFACFLSLIKSKLIRIWAMNKETRIKSPQVKDQRTTHSPVPIYELFSASVQNGMYNILESQARFQFLPVGKAQRTHNCCWFCLIDLCFALLFSKQFGWKQKLLSIFWGTLFLKDEAFSNSVLRSLWLRLVPMGSNVGLNDV